jgi:hypothetical protein
MAAQLGAAPLAVASRITDWGDQVQGAADEIQNAMSNLYLEMKADDLNGAKLACTRLQASAEAIRSKLPAPTPVLTAEVSMGVNGLLEATKECLGAGADPNSAQVTSVKRELDLATVHLNNAKSLIQRG